MANIAFTDTGISVQVVNEQYNYDIPKSNYTIIATGIGAAQSISAITKAANGVFTIVNHGFNGGELVQITSAAGGGFTALNNANYRVGYIDADTFTLGVNTSGYAGTYTANSAKLVNLTQVQIGFWENEQKRILGAPIVEITTPTFTTLSDLMTKLRLLFQESSAPAKVGVAITVDTPYAEARAIFVGGDGDVEVEHPDGTTEVYGGLVAGTILPVKSVEVIGSGTTATNLIALY